MKAPKSRLKNLRAKFFSAVTVPAQEHALAVATTKDARGNERAATSGEIRQIVKARQVAILKADWLTTNVDGHQHLICTEGWEDDERASGDTSYATSEGADSGHSHPWIRNADGSLTIGAAAGHAHDLEAQAAEPPEPVEPAEINVTVTVEQPGGEMGKGAPRSARNTKSATRAQETPMATVQIDQSEIDRLRAMSEMPDAHRAHLAKLAPRDQAAFIAASSSDRATQVQKALDADPVYFVAKNGEQYRTSDKRMADVVKANEAQAETIAKMQADADERAITVECAKTAGEILKNASGDASLKAKIVRALKSGLSAEDEAAALKLLKGADAAVGLALGRVGTKAGGGIEATTAAKAYTDALEAFAKANNLAPEAAIVKFVETPNGRDLYNAAASAPRA